MKTLIDKIRNSGRKVGKGVKRGALIAAAVASLGVAGCDLNGPKPVPNYTPEIISNPKTEQVEGTSYNYDVDATDSNGDKLTYLLTQKPDWLNINSDTGVISGTAPLVETDTDYPIEVKTSDGIDTDTQNYILKVKDDPASSDYLDITGRLEDCENDGFEKQGIIKVYKDDGSLDESDFLGQYVMPSAGNFSFGLETLVSELPTNKVIIKARIQNGVPESYVRTIKADVNPNTEPNVDAGTIRVVPYPDLDKDGVPDNTDTFKTHTNDINTGRYGGLIKSDVWNVGILKANPANPIPENVFSGEDLTTSGTDLYVVNKRAAEWSNLLFKVTGRNLNIQLDPPLNTAYTLVGGKIVPKRGWVIIAKDIYAGAPGVTEPYGSETPMVVGSVLTRLNSSVSESSPTPSHENAHDFIAYGGEATTLSKNYTITWTSGNVLRSPGVADEKAAKIVYEDTYSPGEKLDDILGIDF